MKTKTYTVTKTGINVPNPDYDPKRNMHVPQKVSIPVGAEIELTEAKAKALVNKVTLVASGEVPPPVGEEEDKAGDDAPQVKDDK